MTDVVCALIFAYLAVLAIRAISSWFPPPRSGTPWASVHRIAFDLTEPVLAPVRRVIPPAGMLDLSFLAVFIVLVIVQNQICG